MAKFRARERTTVYRGNQGVRVELAPSEAYEASSDDEAKALAASPSVEEVKPRKKKTDDSDDDS